MSLDTLIASRLPNAPPPACPGAGMALVLMGGGARTAYQAGVLKALAHMKPAGAAEAFPFQLLLGTSAGALNATYLASQVALGWGGLPRLAAFWRQLRSSQVYRLNAPSWVRRNILLAGLTLARQVRTYRALLDTLPLVDTLHRAVELNAVEHALQSGALQALAVTASSYTTGEHWTFCQIAPTLDVRPWHRPGRHAEFQPVTIEHLMASSAIPFLFPAVPLWVNGHKEYFGDGSMRQLSPLSPTIQLGARKVLVIGVGQPQRAALGAQPGGARAPDAEPTAGTIAGHAMASVFHDTLMTDVEQAQRVSKTLASLPPELAAALPYRPIEVLALQPSMSLDEIALRHVSELPAATRNTLVGLGALNTQRSAGASAAALASYLLFEPGFVNALITLGEQDAYARKAELQAFFDTSPPRSGAIIAPVL
ncbi:patatin-like phospholipase family protein [Hydrogenophaga sp. OTU3427]|uniref:patatin-like phospholipase family protein n=1 Tax=Hydrogenophaga sp. OTU3427 TaxID=3043856 RepID=UPI00313DE25C